MMGDVTDLAIPPRVAPLSTGDPTRYRAVHKQPSACRRGRPLYVLVPVRIVVPVAALYTWPCRDRPAMCSIGSIEDQRLGRGRVAAGIGGVCCRRATWPDDACRPALPVPSPQRAVVDRRASGICCGFPAMVRVPGPFDPRAVVRSFRYNVRTTRLAIEIVVGSRIAGSWPARSSW